MIQGISITILTKNSARSIQKVLESLLGFEEVLIFDTGSQDATIAIAKSYPNVRVVEGPFEGFGPTHNTAASLASHDWILSLDSDEVLSPLLQKELASIDRNEDTIYRIERANFFDGKHITGCGWSNDRVVRMYHRKKTAFSSDLVHGKVLTNNMSIYDLEGHIEHFPYLSIDDFLHKMQHYSSLFALQNKEKKKSSLSKALLHGFFSFFKSYFLKKGILLGKQGFIISAYNGHVAYYKYLKLAEINKKALHE